MPLPDLFLDGIGTGWKVSDGAKIEADRELEADVVIIGSGAGGGTSAEILSRAGYRVIILEEGGLHTSSDFDLDEFKAYTSLYQEGMTRATRDGAIGILQGRTVGGSTTVNWTSSFRTPEPTLQHWADNFQLKQLDAATLKPWFERMEQRLSVTPWEAHNGNNAVIQRGCEKLGIAAKAIPRNVKGCWNLGYCGTGCATNAKQSMLTTTLPAALQHGAELIYRVRAQKFNATGGRINELRAQCLDAEGKNPSGRQLTLRAKHFILASGALGSPALLLRSELKDPYARAGKRTFLHPSIFAFARFKERIDPYHGAPQSIYSDHYQWIDGAAGRMGFKIEAAPLQPIFMSVIMRGHGAMHRQRMEGIANTAGALALLRDGFHERSPGGTVELMKDGQPLLDYPIDDFLMDGVKRAYRAVGEIYFAAGAEAVFPGHGDAKDLTSYKDYNAALDTYAYDRMRMRLGSAHVMGGCGMSEDPRRGVVNSQGRHHHYENLFVWDGSIFPTSIGANPQLSIYGIVSKLAHDFIGDGVVHL